MSDLGNVGLYFHVPFCLRRCPYCDFYSTTRLEDRNAYARALCRVVESAPLEGKRAVTVYFGGGTPSLLGTELLPVLEAVRKKLPLAADAEITLEANPGAVTEEELTLLRQGGFNRISLGLQAAEKTDLQTLGRIHTAEEGARAVALCRKAGFENLSVDIMLATPGQTVEKAIALAAWAADLGPEHLSAYLLKIEDGTPFARQEVVRRCPDGDEAAEIYLAVSRLLREKGYEHYEISNFARPGFQSRHNTLYWQLDEYLGIGPSAHSLLGGRRFWFPRDLDAFLTAEDPWSLPVDDGPGGGWEEMVMLALRLARGLDLAAARQLDASRTAALEARARGMVAVGLARRQGKRLSLTEEGFLLSNEIITRLIQ